MTAAASEPGAIRSSEPWRSIVETPENRLAKAAVLRMAKRPTFHLLMLHGPGGTGKSLLMNALVRRVIQGASTRTVQSLPANELAFQTDGDVDFQDLLAVDLLIIEDVQHLAANAIANVTRLLDQRLQRRRPTVLTASAGPASLKKLPPRLVSRLVGGLVVAIEPYCQASRKLILARAIETKAMHLEPAALDWLAGRATGGSLRPLLGALDALKASTGGRATPISLELVKQVYLDPPLGVERIVKRVAETYGIKTKELLGPSRLRTVLIPRQVAMFLARDLASLSLPQIGEHFGGRDHSTVLHSVNKIRTAMAGDRQLAGTIRQLRLELA